MFFSAYTLGCKLNQLETEAIIDSFSREGFCYVPWGRFSSGTGGESPVPPGPAIFIINTCTVTSMAEQKARRVIRKALGANPSACLIITGCYAQLDRDALAALERELFPASCAAENPGRLFVVSGDAKDRLLDLPVFLSAAGIPADFSARLCLPHVIKSWLENLDPGTDGSFRYRPVNFSSHSRGFLKIQDGCDNHCAYCRVSIARGKSRSLRADDVLKELRSLEERGFGEAVLTGVNISQYRDIDMGLPGLLAFLLDGTEKIRIRLSSMEPDFLASTRESVEFIRVLSDKRIRPHFHLSVQSGSAKILSRMGRAYTPLDIEGAADLFRSVREDPFIACDIIAGFPGETDNDYDETMEFCRKIDFAWIHVFPFSGRPGTPAFDFPEKVNEKTISLRVKSLTELARKGRGNYFSRWVGKEVEAIIEAPKAGNTGFFTALSENYLRFIAACGDKLVPIAGTRIRCRILGNGVGERICLETHKCI